MHKVVLSSNLNTTLKLVTYPWTLDNVSNSLYLCCSKISSTMVSNIDSKLFLYYLNDLQVIINVNSLQAELLSHIPMDLSPQELFKHLSAVKQEVSTIQFL